MHDLHSRLMTFSFVGIACGCASRPPPPGWIESLAYTPMEVQEISIGRYGYPYLTIKVNDRPIEVFLDTGNMDGLFLAKRTIESLKLPVDHVTTRRDSDGRAVGTARVYRAEVVAAFGERWTDRLVIERDVPGARGAIGPPYLLGKRLTLDYAQGRLGISESQLPRLPADGVVLEMQPVAGLEGMIVVPGRVHGEDILVQIDTGKSRGCIDPDLAARLGLAETPNGYRVDDIRLGTLSVKVPSARGVRFAGISGGLDRSIEFGLGSDSLKDLLMTVDYHRGVVMLQSSCRSGRGHQIRARRTEPRSLRWLLSVGP